MTLMDADDDPSSSTSSSSAAGGGGAGTPKKSLFRSATWTARTPKPGRPSLPPLLPLRRPTLTEWPRPGSDDCPNPHPPSTPSASSLSRVADHVYLGSDAAARDRDALRRHGITHVLNCVGSACPEYFRGDLAYKTLWLHDSPAEDITSVLYDAFDYLEEVRAARPPGRVLVHCLHGASRSATLVIAYLMWRYAQSFEDALRHVRAARAVTDPNLGFASQLLQCQSRVHALPPSPGSALRAYRMAPHSPYDPLHLVPKVVERPSPARLLDSRGAFVVHVPSAIFVWLGVACEPVMAASASVAASQVVRYERAQGPVVTVLEGSEPAEFWTALMENPAISDQGLNLEIGEAGKRRVELFDLDFEIFRRALKGGVVPPFPMPGSASETRLPARESGWSLLRHRFMVGGAKELVAPVMVSPNDEENRDSFRSPVSFSGEMSSTPSSTSADTASTRSTFSPASSSSLDWFNISPPGSKLYVSPVPKVISGLPPLCPSKEKKEVMSSSSSSISSSSLPSLAERRGSIAPTLVMLAGADDDKCPPSPGDIVRDWCLSPPFVSEMEEERGDMDVDMQAKDACDDELRRIIHPVLFQWPSMAKMEAIDSAALDSRSVYLLIAPCIDSGVIKQRANILYVWLGRESCLMSSGNGCEMNEKDTKHVSTCTDKIVSAELLLQLGLPTDIPVEIVREGLEPEQFMSHLFTFSQAKESNL
ncbi:hypothetical protein J5N97_020751 [Dioscorea zingiberensis]|uniref:Protein-tyrosine-phosphatase MKP1 n=1 Tax=Dioscorea zingiberensis TaxID=325984 RepID=A0A9D5CHQ2_9LILI|nr:hypothetical protein J5N97_020751 [Dioscorea zingiberensis]